MFRVRSPTCAIIVDFEYATMLPHAGGAARDPRYFTDPDPDASEDGYETSGISSSQPCAFYDIVLFLTGVRAYLTGVNHPAALEYMAASERWAGPICTYAKAAMFREEAIGRLVPEWQEALQRTWGKVLVDGKPFDIPEPGQILMDPYFARFRSAGMPMPPSPTPAKPCSTLFHTSITRGPGPLAGRDTTPPDVTFGFRCSESAKGQEVELQTSVVIAPRTIQGRPPPANVNTVPMGRWFVMAQRLVELRHKVSPGRPMTVKEALEWTGRSVVPPPTEGHA